MSTEFTDMMDAMMAAGGKIYYFVLDHDAPQPLWYKVLYAFKKAFAKDDTSMMIVDVPENFASDVRYYGACVELDKFCSECTGIIKYTNAKGVSSEIFDHAGIYVAGNDVRSLPYIDMAESQGKEILSGCDWQSGLFGKTDATDFDTDKDELKIISNEIFVNQSYYEYVIIAKQGIIQKDYERAMSAISVCGNMLYMWNQTYTDDILEDMLSEIADATQYDDIRNMYPDNDSPVLFYDNFGLDTRGLALIYVKALAASGRKFVYLTTVVGKDKQPEIDKVIDGCPNADKLHFSGHNGSLEKLSTLQKIITSVRPSHAFLYTTPDDAAGVIAFMQMAGSVTRYQINLTDHAFWLGRNAFDYCVEFRNYGASISVAYRKISESKELFLPYYPVIDKDAAFQGFPFDATGKKIIFSGGALYKTIDKNLTYYHMISEILSANSDTVFLYAGYGDDTYLNDIQRQFPERVYHIAERTDLFQLLQHITIYISTYPFPGGLMTQYAAIAGKIPFTLCKDGYNCEYLIDQENRQMQYASADSLIADVDYLLQNPERMHKREALLAGSVISEEDFNQEVVKLIDSQSTDFDINLYNVDTSQFIADYRLRFDRDCFD